MSTMSRDPAGGVPGAGEGEGMRRGVRRIVEVGWLDSHGFGGWNTPEYYQEHAHVGPCRSVGYVLSHTRGKRGILILVQSGSDPVGDVHNSINIPHVAILWTRRLR